MVSRWGNRIKEEVGSGVGVGTQERIKDVVKEQKETTTKEGRNMIVVL